MKYPQYVAFILLIFSPTLMHTRSKKITSAVFYRHLRTLLQSIHTINNLVQDTNRDIIVRAATVSSDLTVAGTIKNSAILNLENLSETGFRVLIGTVNTTIPTISSGTGFTIEKIDTGTLQIIFNTPFKDSTIPITLLSTSDSNNTIRTLGLPTNETVIVTRVNDGIFQFIIIGENAQ